MTDSRASVSKEEHAQSEAAAHESADGQSVLVAASLPKKKKKKMDDIFADFGQANDALAVREVDIGGVKVQRFDFKRFWRNGDDLKRFQHALHDRTRFEKLVFDVRDKYNPELGAEISELRVVHNANSRQKHGSSTVALKRTKDPTPKDLKDLQKRMRPKEPSGHKKGGKTRVGGQVFDRSGPGYQDMPLEDMEAIFHADFMASQQSSPRTALESRNALMAHLPEAEMNTTTLPFVSKRPIEMPRTFSMVIFRNGDAHHAGSTVFIKTPVKTLKELFVACGEACTPVIPPVVALLNGDLRPITSLEEVCAEVPLLMKGMELLEPPPSFFRAMRPEGPALKHINAAMQASNTHNQAISSLPTGPLSQQSFRTTSGSMFTPAKSLSLCALSSAPAGSPPWLTQEPWRPQKAGRKWEAPSHFDHILSWAGQGQRQSHHRYETFQPIQLSGDRFRSTSMGMLAAPSMNSTF